MEFEATFGTETPVIGMVHLPPLPGAPKAQEDGTAAMKTAVERATSDARALDRGGVDGIMIENFGDAPFYPKDVPKHVVAAITRAAAAVAAETSLPIGINVLRNDAEAAVSVAGAVGADYIRVNVHTGARVTDQGVIEGTAHETLRLSDQLGVDVGILADAVIATGRGTGEAMDTDALAAVAAKRESYGLDTPILVGSGVRPDTIGEILAIADGVIVGTALKKRGETTAQVDEERVAALVSRADDVR